MMEEDVENGDINHIDVATVCPIPKSPLSENDAKHLKMFEMSNANGLSNGMKNGNKTAREPKKSVTAGIAFKSGKISPATFRGSRPGSAKKSAWERAQERFEAQEKERKKVNLDTLNVDEQVVVRNWSLCDLKFYAKIFRSKKFKNPKLEDLYQRYFFKLNQYNLTVLMGLFCIICVLLVIFYYASGATLPARGVTLGIIVIVFVVLEVLCNRGTFDQHQLSLVCYIIIILLCATVILITLDCDPRSATDGVWCTIFFIYMIYTLLPVRMRIAVLSAVILSLVHVVITLGRNHTDSFLWKQILCNIFVFMCVSVAGIFTHYPTEVAQRKAFLETRRCIEARLTTQRENQQQERLLLSVLPRHVAMEMKADIAGKPKDTMFHKIYIQRHENVR